MSILNLLRWIAGGPNAYRNLATGSERLARDLANSVADRGLLEQREQARTAQLEQAIEALYAEIEERKRAAERLADERNLLHTLIDALPDLVYVKDREGRYVLNNTAHLKFLGASAPEEVAGKTVFDFFPPELATQYHADDLQSIHFGVPLVNDVEPSVDIAGNPLWVLRTKVPLRDNNGEVIGLVGVARDVTQSQTAQAALRESEMRFRSVAQSAGDAIVSADKDGNIIFWNRAAARIFGYAEQDVLGKAMTMLMPERSRVTFGPALDRARMAGDSRVAGCALESDGLRIDGSEFPAEFSLATWEATQGTFFSMTIRDITERKTAEQLLLAMNETLEQRVAERSAAAEQRTRELMQSETALRNQTAILRSVLDNMGEGVIVADEQGAMLLCNPAAEELLFLKSSASQNVGWSANYELLQPDGVTPLPGDEWPMTRALRGESPEEIEVFVRHPDAREGVWLSATAKSLRDEDGTIRGGVAVFHDTTYRKRAEMELKQAKEAAEAANLAKSEFLANMSHEIRTPMTAIIGYSDLLLAHDPSPSERHECLQIIHRNGRHLLDLINDILDISKIEASQMSVERIPCELPRLFAEVVSMMRPRALAKHLVFSVTFAGRIPRVLLTDPLRTRQILVNLLGNAVKFTRRGQVSLQVSCEIGDRSSKLKFEVRDTGIGMTAPQLGRLFKAFTQADESTTRRFGGTGLGLTICRRLARLLGGDVVAESESGVGSVFTAWIDAGSVPDGEIIDDLTEANLPGAVESQAAQNVLLRGRVLVVDDGRDNQRLISFHLVEAGAEVMVVENGRQAVEVASREAFDLILMDMQMPELDGYGATSELRRLGHTLPIVALTANAMSDDRDKCLASGCTDYLTKPIERGALLTMLGRYMHTVPGGQSRGPAPAFALASGLPTAPTDGPSSGIEDTPIRSCYADLPKMKKVLAEFVAELPAQVAKINECLARNELDSVRRAAHQIKGAGGGYGFPQLTEPAGRLEQSVKESSSLDDITSHASNLIAILRRLEGYRVASETIAECPIARAS
jgi:PAS domain S-box-containing protein